MNKREFFFKAMQAECFKKKPWIICAFCLTHEAPEAFTRDPYPYRIVSTPSGYSYCDPDNPGNLIKIEDAVPGQPLFGLREKVEITPADTPGLKTTTTVSYGNLLQNWILVIYPFEGRVEYIARKFGINDVLNAIKTRLADDPEEGEEPDVDQSLTVHVNLPQLDALLSPPDNNIYVSNYLRFNEAADFLSGLSQVCTWGASEKTMLPAPGIIEKRQELLEQNKDNLNDATTIAKIEKDLVNYDKAWIKGSPAENFLLSAKAVNIVRKKMYCMTGAETGLDDNAVKRTLIPTSLSEGWEVKHFPDYMNSVRAGAFNRGAETVLGGVAVKWLQRASSNVRVTIEDCGTTLGRIIDVNQSNFNRLLSRYVSTDGSDPVLVSDESQAGAYIGKRITMRSPMYCKLGLTDFCQKCVGARLSLNPEAAPSSIADYGAIFLYLFMAAAHAKELALAKMDYKLTII